MHCKTIRTHCKPNKCSRAIIDVTRRTSTYRIYLSIRRSVDLLLNNRRCYVNRAEQVAADGDEVNSSADEDKTVPDGVCEWYHAIALEEHHADDVDGAACR